MLSVAVLLAQALVIHGPYVTERTTVRLDGDSNLKPWSCEAGAAEAYVSGEPVPRTVAVRLPVAAFRCEDGILEGKLREALQARRFPSINFTLESVRVLSPSSVQVTGALTLSGQTGTTTFDVAVIRARDGSFELNGALQLSMSEFGIDPPTAFLGIIKAADRVQVTFAITARRSQ